MPYYLYILRGQVRSVLVESQGSQTARIVSHMSIFFIIVPAPEQTITLCSLSTSHFLLLQG